MWGASVARRSGHKQGAFHPRTFGDGTAHLWCEGEVDARGLAFQVGQFDELLKDIITFLIILIANKQTKLRKKGEKKHKKYVTDYTFCFTVTKIHFV